MNRLAAVLASLLIASAVLSGCTTKPKPIEGPYLRGVNNMTFLWFEGYGDKAGNESQASYAFEAAHGVDVVRLPIAWERIQPRLGGDLAPAELERLVTEIGRAHAAGIDVIVDLHNGCRYKPVDAPAVRCSRGLDVEHFTDLWTRLSLALKDIAGVTAYDLMNEPNGLVADNSNTRADAEVWERYSQAAVDAIRATGDNRRLMVEGVSWSNVDKFAELHPKAWITDPRQNVVYSAHHYFDQTGRYTVGTSKAPELRYSFWANKFENDGTTGGEPFDEWNIARLQMFVDWLAENQVRGDIGEVGWPSVQEMTAVGLPPSEAAEESRRWNELGERWFQLADASSLSVTYWAASGLQFLTYPGAPPGLPEPNAVFVHGAGNGELRDAQGKPVLTPEGRLLPRDIDTANSQYEVLSRHPSKR